MLKVSDLGFQLQRPTYSESSDKHESAAMSDVREDCAGIMRLEGLLVRILRAELALCAAVCHSG